MQPTKQQLFRRKLLLARNHFKNKSYTTHRGALNAMGRFSDVIELENYIFRAGLWSDNRYRLEIPVIKHQE